MAGLMPSNPKLERRRDFIRSCEMVEGKDVLEIGAFANPTFGQPEAHVHHADRLPTALLRAVAGKTGKRDTVVPVDFVIPDTLDVRGIKRKFDLIVANQVIEHTPNMLGWLLAMSSLIKPGGCLYLAVTDRDYTHDKLRDLSTLREIMLLHEIQGTRPFLAQVVDSRWGYRPIKLGSDVWDGGYEPKLSEGEFDTYGAARLQTEGDYDNSSYIDCTCHVFTAASFETILRHLGSLEWFPFQLARMTPPRRPYNEFLTVLTLKG